MRWEKICSISEYKLMLLSMTGDQGERGLSPGVGEPWVEDRPQHTSTQVLRQSHEEGSPQYRE